MKGSLTFSEAFNRPEPAYEKPELGSRRAGPAPEVPGAWALFQETWYKYSKYIKQFLDMELSYGALGLPSPSISGLFELVKCPSNC